MNPTVGLHENLTDLAEIGETVLMMYRSQSDKERAGKTADRVSEGRFEGKVDETKDSRKDRLKKQVFLIENSIPLQFSQPHVQPSDGFRVTDYS